MIKQSAKILLFLAVFSVFFVSNTASATTYSYGYNNHYFDGTGLDGHISPYGYNSYGNPYHWSYDYATSYVDPYSVGGYGYNPYFGYSIYNDPSLILYGSGTSNPNMGIVYNYYNSQNSFDYGYYDPYIGYGYSPYNNYYGYNSYNSYSGYPNIHNNSGYYDNTYSYNYYSY